MKKIAEYVKPYSKYLIAGPLFKLTEAVFELFVPLVMARIIDVGVARGDVPYILKNGGLLVLLGLCGLLCAFVCQYSAAVASQGSGAGLREALFKKVMGLSFAQFDRYGSMTLLNRMTDDVNRVSLAVAMLIRLAVRAPFLAVGAIIMSMTIDMKLSVIFLIATAAAAAVIWFCMSRTLPHYRTLQTRLDRLSRIIRENLTGARVIRSASGEDTEESRFSDASDRYKADALKIARIASLQNPLTYVIINLAVVAIIYFGAGRAEPAGTLSRGELVALINYMLQTLAALVVVANIFVIFTRAVASAGRIEEILTLPDENALCGGKDSADERVPAGGVSRSGVLVGFENVSFSYGGANVLEDVSFTIPRGSYCGIVGATGAGKSTLVALLCGFYKPAEGSVSYGGAPLGGYSRAQLAAKIRLVPQHASLVSGTVAENLRLGCPDASDDELWEALRAAQAEDFVRKAGGLDRKIERGGANLSGGQRQRLTVARALVGKPELLILDDSTSALDRLTATRLNEALKAPAYENMTRLYVTQRPAALRDADMIIVLDDGKIAGCGTYSALAASCPVFSEIIAAGY